MYYLEITCLDGSVYKRPVEALTSALAREGGAWIKNSRAPWSTHEVRTTRVVHENGAVLFFRCREAAEAVGF
jgi:hypothetical protein